MRGYQPTLSASYADKPKTLLQQITSDIWKQRTLYLMLVPSIIFMAVMLYYPMWGVLIAFLDYNVYKGFSASEWVGLKNFQDVLSRPLIRDVIFNTVYIALFKIVLGQMTAIIYALLLNEVRLKRFKGLVQTISTFPNFLSWVVIGGIMLNMFNSTGLINQSMESIGIGSVGFLSDKTIFPWTLIISDIWKGFGFGAIIYLAALTQVNPELYEASVVDGANRWQRMWYISLPSISPVIILMSVLSLGNILNANFDQVLVLYNPLVYETGDILDTYVYRVGLINRKYEIGVVVGLIKGVVSITLIGTSYWLARRFANYRIF